MREPGEAHGLDEIRIDAVRRARFDDAFREHRRQRRHQRGVVHAATAGDHARGTRLRGAKGVGVLYQWDMLTLEHYQAVFGSSEFWRGFSSTMFLGLVGATLTMLLGATVAYMLGPNEVARPVADRFDGLAAVDDAPVSSLVSGFSGVALLPHAIPICSTIWALLLAYISLGTPLSVRAMSSTYAQLSFHLEECSQLHGASWLQTMRRIVLALAWPSFAVGWVLVFFGIMRELKASVLLYSVGFRGVVCRAAEALWANGNAEQVALDQAHLMMVLVIVFRWVQLKFISSRIGGMLTRLGSCHVECRS